MNDRSPNTSRLALLTLALLATAVLPGCFLGRDSINEPIDFEKTRSLVPGKSTAAQCVELLGAPNEVIQLGKRSAYRYDHTSGKSAGMLLIVFVVFNEDVRQDRVWLFFDEGNVLTHVGSTFASHHTQYSMPWEDIHEASDNESRDVDRGVIAAPKAEAGK